MIRMGQAWNRIKSLVTRNGAKWQTWVKDELGSKAIRTVQDYMRLASIPSVMDYIALGKSRLMVIARVVESSEGENPIGDFLVKHNIQFNPEEDTPVEKLEVDVKTPAVIERLKQKGVHDVDGEKVRQLLSMGCISGSRIVKHLLKAHESDGNLNELLDKLIANNGKLDSERQNPNKPQHFNEIGQKLTETMEQFSDNESLLKEGQFGPP